MYKIAENSEALYKKSKQKVCEVIGAGSYKEIIYTYNSTYAANLISQTLRFNKKLKA
jgi:selenocysteine lyase/cysteine desulfurase